MGNQHMLWGIDLGGTKIEGVALDKKNQHRILCRKRVPTESHLGYWHIIHQIQLLIENMAEEVGSSPAALGIGTPGTLDPQTQTMKNSNTTCLNGQAFQIDLETALGIPIRMANDANCFALAETKMGCIAEQLPDAQVVFGVIMGTGVGGGLVVNGQIIQGKQGIAGEWGHTYLDESGGACYCGKIGCVETLISGPAVERYYAQLTGIQRPLKALIDLHKNQEDEQATATIKRLLHFFGKGIAQLINIIDPDAIVLGGGLGNIDLLYTAGVEEIKKQVFNPRLDTKILAPKLGDSAGVFGAAHLWD
ncbi:MAG: ROK family protein [Flammeovirgaceae bacterium]